MIEYIRKNIWVAATCILLIVILFLVVDNQSISPTPSKTKENNGAPNVTHVPTGTSSTKLDGTEIHNIAQAFETNMPTDWFVGVLSHEQDPRVYFYDPRNFTETGDCEYGACVVFDNKKYRDTKTDRNERSLWTDNGRVYGKMNLQSFDAEVRTSEELLHIISIKYPSSTSKDCGPGFFREPMRIIRQQFYPAVGYSYYPLCNYENNSDQVATNTYFVLVKPDTLLKLSLVYERFVPEADNARKEFENLLASISFEPNSTSTVTPSSYILKPGREGEPCTENPNALTDMTCEIGLYCQYMSNQDGSPAQGTCVKGE